MQSTTLEARMGRRINGIIRLLNGMNGSLIGFSVIEQHQSDISCILSISYINRLINCITRLINCIHQLINCCVARPGQSLNIRQDVLQGPPTSFPGHFVSSTCQRIRKNRVWGPRWVCQLMFNDNIPNHLFQKLRSYIPQEVASVHSNFDPT